MFGSSHVLQRWLGPKSTYRREMHLAFYPSRQLIEVANIFSALRAHHQNCPMRPCRPMAGTSVRDAGDAAGAAMSERRIPCFWRNSWRRSTDAGSGRRAELPTGILQTAFKITWVIIGTHV